MSFLDDIVEIGSSAASYLSGNSLAGTLARTALLGLAVNQITKSVTADNAKNSNTLTDIPDPQTKLQNNADTENKIPVVYGDAFLGGSVTDAVLAEDGLTMTFCLTISEKTGKVNLGQGADSVFTFKEPYWNGNKMVFKADGITVDYVVDPSGNIDNGLSGLIKIWCFDGSSTDPVAFSGYTNTPTDAAYTVMPGWTTSHTMSDLVFAIVQVKYDSTHSLTSLGTITFHMSNTLTQPGDCLYDYMTNTRYGAGLDPSEIYAS